MSKVDIRKITNFKIRGEELYAKVGEIWYLVTASTNEASLSLPTIFYNKPAEKGGNGLKITLSGRLKGVRMARKFEEHQGVGLRTQSIEWGIEEEKRPIFTKWGTIGLRVCRGGGKER